nr:MAG TPA: hypothetical protein [Bacteriophage sp.]
MTAKEMELERECEYYKMKTAELEKADIFVNKVKEIFDNAKQRYKDVTIQSNNNLLRVEAKNKMDALIDLEKELGQVEE